MKFFVVADVHGFYNELIEALDNKGFDINNESHVFVSCGDLLDRGPDAKKCLDFVNNLPKDRKILIRGNHEDLLEDAIHRGFFLRHDYHNCTNETVYQLSGIYPDRSDVRTWSGADNTALLTLLSNTDWKQYLNDCIDFYETEEYIFVHGWIPCSMSIEPAYIDDWRLFDFKDFRWLNGMNCWNMGIREPGKTIVCGHWHTSWGHFNIHNEGVEWDEVYYEEDRPKANFKPFIDDGIIALDACTAYSGFVNCIVLDIEDN